MSALARRLGRAYLSIGRRLAAALLLLAVAAATSVIVVLPFWYLATAHRRIFNLLVMALAAGGIAWVAARRLAAARSTEGARGLRVALMRTVGAAAGFLVLYAALWAFASGRPVLGAAAAAALVLAVGLTAR